VKQKTITVRLDRPFHDRLRAASFRLRTSQASIVKAALATYLDDLEKRPAVSPEEEGSR
jgi:predicted DNA-binding protein